MRIIVWKKYGTQNINLMLDLTNIKGVFSLEERNREDENKK